jgi:hypothetical protein
MSTDGRIDNDPFKLKAWRTKNYKRKTNRSIWSILLNPPTDKKEG